jgi:hypothetical protein
MKKEFSLSKEELFHFDSITYTMSYLEQSAKQFIGGIITQRLGEDATNKDVTWVIEGNNLVLEIVDKQDAEPTDFFVSDPSKQ